MAKRARTTVDGYLAKACYVKKIPSHLAEKAAEFAISMNPANAPAIYLVSGNDSLPTPSPAELAFLTGKYWGSGGVRLTVAFATGTRNELKVKVIEFANLIGQHGNVNFRDVPSNGDVRVSFGPGGYWSYLGTDIKQIPRNQQTMNLEGFRVDTPETEWLRVVPHEFLHTCGAPHEHSRKSIVDRLDVQKTLDYFRRSQGWSEQEVYQQILTPLEERSILGSPNADEESIMAYWFPGQITKNGQPIKGGGTFSATDKDFIARTYPKEVQPPPPPDGGEPVHRVVLESKSPIRVVTQTAPGAGSAIPFRGAGKRVV